MPATNSAPPRRTFCVEIIKPNRYDDDGYVVQWLRAYIPSNSLGCIYGLVMDVQDRKALGDDVDLVVNAYDESYTVISTRKIIKRIRRAGGQGIVLLAGVQTNQFPRAVDLGVRFLAAGIPVCIGGFHVSGCLAMLDDLPEDLREAIALGLSLFGGELEGRLESLLRDADRGALRPLYPLAPEAPQLGGQPVPYLPVEVIERMSGKRASFDAGRGCPFQCSFCTIINVQGRKSRRRSPDDVEALIRLNWAQGIRHFVDCLVDGREPLVPGEDGLAVTRIIAEIRQSLASGIAVDVAPS